MFLADCHTHSLCSPDSNAPMLQMAQKAYEYGLHTLCLTDHCDLLSLEGERTLDYDWTPVHRERKGMLRCPAGPAHGAGVWHGPSVSRGI